MNDFLILELKIIPNKKQSRLIEKMDNGAYKVELKAKPIKGQANRELTRFLGKLLGLKHNQVILIRGVHSHHKVVKLNVIDKNRILEILNNEI